MGVGQEKQSRFASDKSHQLPGVVEGQSGLQNGTTEMGTLCEDGTERIETAPYTQMDMRLTCVTECLALQMLLLVILSRLKVAS